MSTKDFMRGVETAAKANAAFMKKQAEATEELGKRIIKKIDEQGKIIEVILDVLNNQEKKELYALQNAYDIADLGENEKEVLASILLTLISKYGQDTENQKDYYFAAKKYLGVTDASPDFDLTLIENVDSRADLKAMYKTVCEFLFIKTGEFSFLYEFEEELSYFGLHPKVAREIGEQILTIYNVLGLRGIVEHYIPVNPDDEKVPEHYGLIMPLEGKLVIDDSNRDVEAGTEKVFENLSISIKKQLHIYGKAIFRNCEINLDYDGKVTILVSGSNSEAIFLDCEFKVSKQAKSSMLSVSGKCIFRDCLFSDVKYRYGMHDDVFKYDDGEAFEYNCAFVDVDGVENTAKLIVEHCHIEGCEGTFINADGNHFGSNFNVLIQDSLINEHTDNFMFIRYADRANNTGVQILNTIFSNIAMGEKADSIFIPDNDKTEFIVVEDTSFICTDCIFSDIEKTVFKLHKLFDSSPCDILRCKFENCKLATRFLGTVRDCEFINMSRILFGNCGEFDNRVVTVSNNKFLNINGSISLRYGLIEHCTFYDSKIVVDIEGKPKGDERYVSEARDLTFINCTAEKAGLGSIPCFLQARSYLDKEGNAVDFVGCKFKNCRTAGKYINTYITTYGWFDREKIVEVGSEYRTSIE